MSEGTNLLPEFAVKTIIADYDMLEAILPTGSYKIDPKTTLNTLYNNFNAITDVRSVPPIAYFTMGIDGFVNIGDKNQATPYIPKSDEFGLYTPLPFRVVEIDQDLTTAERNQYRMRVRITHKGQQYFAYYLKCITVVDNVAEIVRIDPATKQEIPYEFNTTQLTPTPQIPETSGVQSGDITSIIARKRIKINITGNEVYEAINVLYDGDLRNAKISELGLVSGVDRVVDSYDGANNSMKYTEAVCARLMYKLCNLGTVFTSASQVLERVLTFGNGRLISFS